MKTKLYETRRGFYLSFLLAILLLGVMVCNAAPISYNVNRTIGIGSVTGFIATDGSLGVLTSGNIVDWTLLLDDGTSTFTLTGPLSGNNSVVFSQGIDISATATQLLFDFSGVDDGIFLFQQGLFSGMHYYCAASQSGTCFQGETVVPISVFQSFQNDPRTGNLVIGTAASSVPEPGTCGLLLTGLGMWISRRKGLRNL